MAAPAMSRASGEASPEAPISAAMVSVVAAVGATLVMEAIQSPRRPTDLGRKPSLLMTRNPLRRPRTSCGQDGRPTAGNHRPVGGVGDRPRPGPRHDERVLRLRAAD